MLRRVATRKKCRRKSVGGDRCSISSPHIPANGFLRIGFSRFACLRSCCGCPPLWVPPSVDTWQLVINTVTAIITFLLVALLQNTQPCADKAMQQKLNALADALWDLMGELGDVHPELRRHRRELADAVGLEQREARIETGLEPVT